MPRRQAPRSAHRGQHPDAAVGVGALCDSQLDRDLRHDLRQRSAHLRYGFAHSERRNRTRSLVHRTAGARARRQEHPLRPLPPRRARPRPVQQECSFLQSVNLPTNEKTNLKTKLGAPLLASFARSGDLLTPPDLVSSPCKATLNKCLTLKFSMSSYYTTTRRAPSR